MTWIAAHIRWVMLISGALTSTMVYAAIAPQAALQSTFGETLEGPLAEILVRNWGALVGLVGVMLIVGAFHAPSRALALTIAGVSKAVFITLVATEAPRFLFARAGLAVVSDVIAVGLYIAYAMGPRRATPSIEPQHTV